MPIVYKLKVSIDNGNYILTTIFKKYETVKEIIKYFLDNNYNNFSFELKNIYIEQEKDYMYDNTDAWIKTFINSGRLTYTEYTYYLIYRYI